MRNILALGATLVALGAPLSFAVEAESSFDRSLSVSGPVELEVQTDSGGIKIVPGHSGSVHVHAILKAQNGWFGAGDVERRIQELVRNPPIEQNGNRVRIGYAEHNLLRNISMRLEIETPTETKVSAHADSGGIRVSGVHGRVDCKTDSGGVDIADVPAEVHAAADSGGVHIRNVRGAVYAHVDSGGISAENISGPVEAHADSGHIQISQTTAAPVNAKADSGGISVALAHGAGYDISAESGSGGIAVRELNASTQITKHHVEGKVNGGGPLVSVQVDSGGISIE
jgi:Putative adhesin